LPRLRPWRGCRPVSLGGSHQSLARDKQCLLVAPRRLATFVATGRYQDPPGDDRRWLLGLEYLSRLTIASGEPERDRVDACWHWDAIVDEFAQIAHF
jgi:hypothetical protein